MNRRDIGAASRYIMDDCVFSDDNGGLSTKSEYLQHFGATAVLNFRVTDLEQFGETPRTGAICL